MVNMVNIIQNPQMFIFDADLNFFLFSFNWEFHINNILSHISFYLEDLWFLIILRPFKLFINTVFDKQSLFSLFELIFL